MRILFLSLSLFVVQNAFPVNTIIEPIKAVAPGFAFSILSGAIKELLHPHKSISWFAVDTIGLELAIITSLLTTAHASENLNAFGYGYASPLVSLILCYMNLNLHISACQATEYIQNTLVTWNDKNHNNEDMEIQS